MDENYDSVVQSGPDVVVGVVSSCSSARQRSGRHTGVATGPVSLGAEGVLLRE